MELKNIEWTLDRVINGHPTRILGKCEYENLSVNILLYLTVASWHVLVTLESVDYFCFTDERAYHETTYPPNTKIDILKEKAIEQIENIALLFYH